MDVATALKTRRAVKHFDSSFEIPAEELDTLVSLALESPTAFNIQHWRLVLVEEEDLRAQIRAVAWDQAQVTDASALFILCADTKAWEKEPIRYWKDAPEPVQEFMIPAITQYYEGKDQVQRDEAMRSCGILAQSLMLGATSLGYQSCPMDGFDFEAVGELINLPEDHLICMFVAVGKGTKEAWPKPGQLPAREVLLRNRFA